MSQQSVSCRLCLIIFGAEGDKGSGRGEMRMVVDHQLIFFHAGAELPETWPGSGSAAARYVDRNSHACVLSVPFGDMQFVGGSGVAASPLGPLWLGLPAFRGGLPWGCPWSLLSSAAAPGFHGLLGVGARSGVGLPGWTRLAQ